MQICRTEFHERKIGKRKGESTRRVWIKLAGGRLKVNEMFRTRCERSLTLHKGGKGLTKNQWKKHCHIKKKGLNYE